MALIDVLTAALDAEGIGWTVAGGKPAVLPGVVIWQDGPVRTPTTIADTLGEQTTVLVCHCVGLTPESCAVAEKKLAAAVAGLLGQTIDGQVVAFMPVQNWSQPMTRDDDTSPPLYDLPSEWRIRTTPA